MRVRPTILPAILTSLLGATALTAQVSLKDLPEIARQRAERLRPLQVAALQPFWADFSELGSSNSEGARGISK